ncbi:hypothetical protein QVD17_01919 [Tagetes erecta]|uniref:WRKY domain-containing protein n=1 Tax=Tagetes erecta TaxID=13708 RepID=A0AAD8P7A2_TARER|nr:hypothetical protein QVD17_01919 [Tagetes erecta]
MNTTTCVYEEKKVIHELTQGIQMAKQLKLNLHSPEARDFLIKQILSSYENALFVLKSGDFARQSPAPAQSMPESSIFTGCEEFEFGKPFMIQQGQNIISQKRKRSTTWEDEVRVCNENGLEDNTNDSYHWRKYGHKEISGSKFPRCYYKCSYRKVQKCMATKQVQRTDEDPAIFNIAYKGKHTCNLGVKSSSPVPLPPLPKEHEITPTHQHHQLSPPNPGEMLSILKANLSVDTTDLSGDTVPSPFSFHLTSSGLMEDFDQFHFPNQYDDELWQAYSSAFISPATSESNIFTEWGSSSSLDFMADPTHVDADFDFRNNLF